MSYYFRKKPIVIEAIRWDGANIKDMHIFMRDIFCDTTIVHYDVTGHMFIPTLEGEMTANPGDWIIKGVKGEFYPCKHDIFEATYEVVEQANAETAESLAYGSMLSEGIRYTGPRGKLMQLRPRKSTETKKCT